MLYINVSDALFSFIFFLVERSYALSVEKFETIAGPPKKAKQSLVLSPGGGLHQTVKRIRPTLVHLQHTRPNLPSEIYVSVISTNCCFHSHRSVSEFF